MNHRIDVRSNIDRTAFGAYCSCGWIGSSQASRGAAEREGDEHVTYMVMIGESNDSEE